MQRTWNPSYASWWHAKDRCTNESSPDYENWGGRGIFMCTRWLNFFNAFVEDMGTRPENMMLERIDNEGPYSVENCKWADRITQSNNRRNNRWLEYKGVCKTLAQWCVHFNLGNVSIGTRLDAGWSVEEALEIVIRPNSKRNRTTSPIAEEKLKRRLVYNELEHSIVKWSEITGIDYGTILRRIDRNGWTSGQALEYEPSPTQEAQILWTYDSVTMSIKEWSVFIEKSENLLRWRAFKAKWPLEEVLGFKQHTNARIKPPKKNGPPLTLTYNGQTKTFSEWAKERNIKVPALRARLRKGKTLEEALNFKPLSPGMS